VATLDRLVAERGTAPGFIRCDNGPELTANALRDWCRFSKAGSAYIEPGSPWQNPYVESFGSRIRDELLAVELFSCLAEARVLVEDWRVDYNEHRPHSALGMMAPAVSPAATRPTWRPRPPAPNCARPPVSLRSTPAGSLPCSHLPTTSSHSRWTNERGPVIDRAASRILSAASGRPRSTSLRKPLSSTDTRLAAALLRSRTRSEGRLKPACLAHHLQLNSSLSRR
jgi:hypothetical protein